MPRNFVLRESALVQLARRPTTRTKNLASRGLLPQEIRRYGAKLCRIAEQANRLKKSHLPAKAEGRADISSYKQEVNALRAEVGKLAEELGIAPELLATRRAIEELFRQRVILKTASMPEQLCGWRQGIIEGRLVPFLDSMMASPSPPDPGHQNE